MRIGASAAIPTVVLGIVVAFLPDASAGASPSQFGPAPAISVGPSSGPVGSTGYVSGGGWQPGTSVQLSCGGCRFLDAAQYAPAGNVTDDPVDAAGNLRSEQFQIAENYIPPDGGNYNYNHVFFFANGYGAGPAVFTVTDGAAGGSAGAPGVSSPGAGGPGAGSGTPSAATAGPGPSFVYPQDGQPLDYVGSYMFKVNPVDGATGYLFGLFQNGSMIWENYRDEHHLSDTEYAIHPDNPGHNAFTPGPVQVWVRALVNNQWTNPTIITITLR